MDFRERYRLSLNDAGAGIPWEEAGLLVAGLLMDPSTNTGAKKAGWRYPLTQESMVAMDTFDAFIQLNTEKGKKPMKYPRPWDKEVEKETLPGLTPKRVVKLSDAKKALANTQKED